MADNGKAPKRGSAEHIKVFMAQEKLTVTQMGEIMRLSVSGVSHMINTNDAPAWTVPLIEGLKRLNKADPDITFVAKLPKTHFATISHMINSLGGKVTAL